MYNHEREMEKLYEMKSLGILSTHHTHNIGHILVIGHNPATNTPTKPPSPIPPSPIPPSPLPEDHKGKKKHHNNASFLGITEGVIDFLESPAHGNGSLHSETGKN